MKADVQSFRFLVVLLFLLGQACWKVHGEKVSRSGAEIYRELCASCHGPAGQGVADKHDEPLYGDRSLASLTRLIEKTMPEDAPEKCTGEDAAKVAAYIYDTFYSPQARARIHPPKIQLSRLTVPQYLNATADLISSFGTAQQVNDARGLQGHYYNARNFKGDKKAFSRVDPVIRWQFDRQSPDPEKIGTEEFSIRWEGSVLIEETGDYAFALKTENGARLWVNGANKPLIDAWVSAGGEVREEQATIRLLGGRAYPIRLDFFKYKDKSASLALLWKAPHKEWELVPSHVLSPKKSPQTLVITTAFPPDDSSAGYERGTAVSKAWDQAATFAAVETAAYVVEHLEALSGCTNNAPDRPERLQRFCEQFTERAFRRPLTPAQKQFFVGAQFKEAQDLEQAVKRSVLLTLKSPRFLYPGIESKAPDAYDIASRLSFALWDSMPDQPLLQAAAQGQLSTAEQVTAQAQRMLKDPKAKLKVKHFFHHWLKTEEGEEVSKDPAAYPDFNEGLLSDLRTSLDLFVDHVVWSEKSDYRELLLADYLFANQRLAQFYGLKKNSTDDFEKVSLDAKQRAGVLTHPYLLTAFAYYKSSSPIHRGVFLTRSIMGRSLKPPPMAIQFMDGRFDPSLTMREKVTELTKPNNCQSCHSIINPLGFSLEHFDAVGRYRTTEQQKPIDAASDYPTTDGETIRLTGARDVAEYAAASEEAHRGFIRQLFEQMVKQPIGAYGPDTLEQLRRSFAASQFNIQQLLVNIVTTSALHGVESIQETRHE